MSESRDKGASDVELTELEQVSGGATQTFFSNVGLGLDPSHSYGMITDSYGQDMQYGAVNESLQRYNAPTAEGLYGAGNDVSQTEGTVSRPGAGWLTGSGADWGGQITMERGDGWVRNTTVPGQHPLEGWAQRMTVIDYNEGGGYQTMTVGQGQGGAVLLQTIGGAAGGPLGALAAQNGSHFLNPGLGQQAFPQLDAAQRAYLTGQPNPNLSAPQGPLTEAGGLFSSVVEGIRAVTGNGSTIANPTTQDRLLYDVARDLAQQGPFDGRLDKSATGGIYLTDTATSTTRYFERGADGSVVERQVDPFGGFDKAAALVEAKNMLPGDPIYQNGEILQQQADLDAMNGMMAGDPIAQSGDILQQQADLDAANGMMAGDPIAQSGDILQQQADLDAANGMMAGDPIAQYGELQAQTDLSSMVATQYEPYEVQSSDSLGSFDPMGQSSSYDYQTDYQSPLDSYQGMNPTYDGSLDTGYSFDPMAGTAFDTSSSFDSGYSGFDGGFDGGYGGGFDSGGFDSGGGGGFDGGGGGGGFSGGGGE